MTQDFQGTVPVPRIARRHEPYEPIEADESRILEMREGARIEAARNARVQAYLAERRARTAQRIAERAAESPPVYSTLPTADEAQHAIKRARETLFVAIEARNSAQEALQDAQRAAQAGADAASRLSDEVTAADQVDQEIATHQAEAIRTGRDEPLPESLQVRRAERDALAQQYRDARAAVEVLEADHAAARQAHDAATGRADEAVGHVLDAILTIDAIEMLACVKRAAELRGRITSVRNVVIGGRRHVLPVAVGQALHDAAAEQQRHHDDTDRWRDLVAALADDADAQLKLS